MSSTTTIASLQIALFDDLTIKANYLTLSKTVLTHPVLSRTKRENQLQFYFYASLWFFKRFYELLKGLHKIFRDTTKCENNNLS